MFNKDIFNRNSLKIKNDTKIPCNKLVVVKFNCRSDCSTFNYSDPI